MTAGWLLWPLIPAAAMALSIVVADYQLANSARTVAKQIATKYKSASHTMWFEGHGAFQYYTEKFGGQPIDFERSLLQPGDIVVVSWLGGNFVPFPDGSVGWIAGLGISPFSWMNLMFGDKNSAAGFYGANYGPVPFAIGKLPRQDYFVVKVFSRVQYNTRPANPREVQAGDVPRFSSIPFAMEDKTMVRWEQEAIKQDQLASQLEAEGKIEEAIQHYRKTLDVDSNNPVVLNNLAWILTTTSKPELRNGEEAVQLARRAVILTDSRLPILIGTLAAAFAEAGQFPQACETAHVAHDLALLTGQKDIADANAKLWTLYSSGKAADAAPGP